MFSEEVIYTANQNNLDQQQSKELERYISKKKKKKIVLHSLLHGRCKFCSNSFSSIGCRNCCLPMCQEFKKVSTKKLLKNGIGVNNNNNNASSSNGKKYSSSKSVGHLGLATCEPFLLDTPPSASSPRLSPSASARNLMPARPSSTNSNKTTGSVTFAVVDADNNNPHNLPFDKMSLQESDADNYNSSLSTTDTKQIYPSAPSPGLVLFNNEEQSDIFFMVGPDDAKPWRFPAHTFIVKEASKFFHAIALAQKDNIANNNNDLNQGIRINWCDPSTFHTILKYIYIDEVSMKSVGSVLSLFNASNSFYMFNLSKLCLTFLLARCNQDNVLEVLSFFNNYFHSFHDQQTHKKSMFNGQAMENDELLNTYLNELIIKCFGIVDQNAEKIIFSEEFANLDWDLVEKILSRDTLNIASELTVYNAIDHWACQQCKKTCKELVDKNKRDTLQELVYYPRYLTMNIDDFMKGPYSSEILTNDEKQLFLGKLNSDANAKLPKHLEVYKMDIARRYESIDEYEDEEDEGSSTVETDSTAENDNGNSNNKQGANCRQTSLRKKRRSKKILNGIGDFMICFIKLLD